AGCAGAVSGPGSCAWAAIDMVKQAANTAAASVWRCGWRLAICVSPVWIDERALIRAMRSLNCVHRTATSRRDARAGVVRDRRGGKAADARGDAAETCIRQRIAQERAALA